jgi:hypothetical protein
VAEDDGMTLGQDMEEKPLFMIAVERIFDRILKLPKEKRTEALSILTDCCLPNPPAFFTQDLAVKKLMELIGPIP